jgi:hypothetical protein
VTIDTTPARLEVQVRDDGVGGRQAPGLVTLEELV